MVVEDITGDTPILVIRGMNYGFGNRIGSQHVIGFAIAKIAINHTGSSWTEYRMELRTTPDGAQPLWRRSLLRPGLYRRRRRRVRAAFTTQG